MRITTFFIILLFPITGSAKETLCLIENKGQITDQYGKPRKDIDYKIPGGRVNVFVGSGELHYQFWNQDLRDLKDRQGSIVGLRQSAITRDANQGEVEMYRLDVELVNADKNAQVISEQKTGYYENYYLPQCPIGATAYAYNKATYKNVYPNIDWVVYIKDGMAEYDFVVREGGNVKDIRLKYSGATQLAINTDGSITATTPMGTISEAAPYCYDASGKRVNATFMLNNGILTFKTDSYKGTLVIDPTLQWATYYGRTEKEDVEGMTTDNLGNVYITGGTTSYANMATTGSHQPTFGGGNIFDQEGDAYLVKFNSAGVREWATYYGGSENDRGNALTTDDQNNVYLGGSTKSSYDIATPGAYQMVYAGASYYIGDAYIAKFTPQGTRIWATYYGGERDDAIYAIKWDGAGHLYATGTTASIAAVATPGSHQTVRGGPSWSTLYDAYLVKFDTAGNRVWGTYYGGPETDFAKDVEIDHDGNVYIAGTSESTTGIASVGTHQPTYGGDITTTSLPGPFGDAFIAKFDTAGVRLWATYYGGYKSDIGNGLAIDVANSVYLCGYTLSDTAAIATPGSHMPIAQNTTANGRFGYLAKFSPDGNRQWGTYFGLTNTEFAGMSHKAGKLYLTGSTSSFTDIASTDAYQYTKGGDRDAMLISFDTAGTLLYGTYYGDTLMDRGTKVRASIDGGIYLGGTTQNPSGIATTKCHQQVFGGIFDGFLVKFNDSSLSTPAISLTQQKTIALYPNPNTGDFTLHGTITSKDGKATVQVMDITGRAILKEEFTVQQNTVHHSIGLQQSLPAGVYILHLRTDSGQQVLQFVKE